MVTTVPPLTVSAFGMQTIRLHIPLGPMQCATESEKLDWGQVKEDAAS